MFQNQFINENGFYRLSDNHKHGNSLHWKSTYSVYQTLVDLSNRYNTDRSFDQPKIVYTNFLQFQVFAGIWFLILFNHDNILITAITSIDVRAFINMEIHYTGRLHIVFSKHLLTWATCTTQIDPSINRNLFTRIFYDVKFLPVCDF